MSRLFRPLMIVAVLLLLAFGPGSVPGMEHNVEDLGQWKISIGYVLYQAFDPLVLGLFLVGGLLGGGARGFLAGLGFLLGAAEPAELERRNAARHALLGAARGLLWGSILVLSLFSAQLYAEVYSNGETLADLLWVDAARRWEFLRVGSFVVLPILVLVLLPGAAGLGQAQPARRTWAHALDASGLCGYALLAFVFALSQLVLQSARADEIASGAGARFYVLPSMDGIDVLLIGWSLLAILILVGLPALPRLISMGSLLSVGEGQSLGLLLLGAGASTSIMIRIADFAMIATSGAAGDAMELQRTGGRMLVPLILALALIGLRRMLAARSSQRPAPATSLR